MGAVRAYVGRIEMDRLRPAQVEKQGIDSPCGEAETDTAFKNEKEKNGIKLAR